MTYKTQTVNTKQLQQIAARYGQELDQGLKEIYDQYFVTRKDVLAVQKQWRRSTDMRPDSFWNDVAVPQTKIFIAAGQQTCDWVLRACKKELLDRALSTNQVQESDRIQILRTLQSGSIHLLSVLPNDKRIDALGKWWLSRLNTAAIKENLTEVLHSDTSELRSLIRIKGADLCTDTSWLYGDRLLSAFEVAHKDLRNYAEKQIAELYADTIQKL